MKHRSIHITLIVVIALLLVAGTVWAMSGETAVSPTSVTDIPFPDQRQAVAEAVDWLVTTHQNDDGGYTNFSSGANLGASGVSGSLDAVQAIAAAGYNPAATYPGKTSNPIAYLQSNAADVADYAASGGGAAGKVILGLTAANQDPYDFMGYNFVISLTTQLSPTGQYGTAEAFDQSLALQALAVVRETTPVSATQWLKDQQAANGSWSSYGFESVDATSMAIMALVAQGEAISSTTLANATTYLADAQLPTGGWDGGFGENANSTGLAVQALSALGENFYAASGNWSQGGNTPLSALLNFQNTTGAFQSDWGSGPFDDFFATVQAVPAAAGKAYPLPARYEAARRAVSCMATLQDTDGGWEQFSGAGVNAGGTSRAIEAIAAFGDDPQSAAWTPGSVNAVDALENLTPAYLSTARGGRVGVVMQGVVAGGSPYTVTNFAGYNLPISVTNYLSPTGEYANTFYGPVAHNEAMLGLIAAGEEPDATAVSWLQGAATNGSWGGADSDGSSISVLSKLGEAIPFGAFANLRNTQQADGGWGFGVPASVNSTAEVVQGLVASGDNPFAPAWSVVMSGTLQNPADAVLAQQGDSGCWPNLWGPGEDPYGTTDGILLLMAQPEWTATPSYLEYGVYFPTMYKN